MRDINADNHGLVHVEVGDVDLVVDATALEVEFESDIPEVLVLAVYFGELGSIGAYSGKTVLDIAKRLDAVVHWVLSRGSNDDE